MKVRQTVLYGLYITNISKKTIKDSSEIALFKICISNSLLNKDPTK